MKRWFVVQTQPGKERLALQHLRNQQFETFCPLRRKPVQSGRKQASALAPFFPSYVFVRLDPGKDRWRSINGTIGVSKLVSFGSDPAAAPNGLVEKLQELCSAEGELSFDEQLQPGDEVRIVGGPLHALCGKLVSETPTKRVTILLDLLSGATKVDVARSRLVSA